MERLPMCRICLVENVRMFVVGNRNLQVLYEKLTDIPFVTEDRRPMLACFFCCAKLKQCYRLLRQCVEAEELFAQMMNTPNPSINQHHLEFFSGFIKSPIENISIVDGGQTENIAVKVELPAVCEGLDVIIEPKEEHQSDELEPENFDSSYLDVADIPLHHFESDLEDDVPLMEFKTEVEEDISMKKQRARKTKCTAEKPKLDTRRIKIEEAITVEQMKNELSDPEIYQNTEHRTSKPVTKLKKPVTDIKPGVNNSFSEEDTFTEHFRTGKKLYKCGFCHCCFSHKGHLTRHVRVHTGEKLNKCEMCQRSFSQFSNLKRHLLIHNGEKPYKCDLCQRCYSDKRDLSRHVRIHNGEKPFKCETCQLSFYDKRDLMKHIRKHTGEKLFKCDICQRCFIYSCDFKKHVRIHTLERPFKCDICQRCFSYSCDLEKHVLIHTGEKPYRCEICQRSFKIKGNLKKHYRIHTGEKM